MLAGKEYGSGSSRDWAAKGTKLLGVRAVIAECYERIHRSNLVGMGVLPLQYRGRRERRVAGADRRGGVLDHRRRGRRGQGGHGPRRRQGVQGARAHRHAQGGPVLPARRHPAVRAALAARSSSRGSPTLVWNAPRSTWCFQSRSAIVLRLVVAARFDGAADRGVRDVDAGVLELDVQSSRGAGDLAGERDPDARPSR